MPTVISTSWSGSTISTRGRLVEKVCAYKGFSTEDTDLTTRALDFLDDSIRDLCTYPWESSKTSETGIVFTLGQQYVTLSSQFFKESQAYLVHNTDGDQPPMISLPWVQFKRLFPGTDTSLLGRPGTYTLYNVEQDGRIYFDTAVDADTVANYTLTVEYYRRLPLISSVGTGASPNIPQEFENTILYGAYKRICAHLGDEKGMSTNATLEREALERLKRIDIMHPDADRRFRLISESTPSSWWRPNSIFPY